MLKKLFIVTLSSLALLQSIPSADARSCIRYARLPYSQSATIVTTNNTQAQKYVSEVLRLVNIERNKHGLSPLRLSRDLNNAAQIRASEIIQMFSHTRPNGQSCFTLVNSNNKMLGENIAAGNASPEATVNQWMNSSGHRANILNPSFRELGVGYMQKSGSKYTNYWVQIFRG